MAEIQRAELLKDAHPTLASRFRAGCERFGGAVRVNSVLRDSDLQQKFFECAQFKNRHGYCPGDCSRSKCAPANRPGTSNHEPHGKINKSIAIDAEPVNENWRAFQAAMRAVKLIFPISHEDWHLQCEETPASYYEVGSEDRIPLVSSSEASSEIPTNERKSMLRVDAQVRTTKLSKEEPLRVYDIFHVWPDKFVIDGVRWTSNLFVFLAEQVQGPIRVRLWAPGGIAGEPRNLHWGEEWWMPSKGFGMVSAVADKDVPLQVFWELSAGKA